MLHTYVHKGILLQFNSGDRTEDIGHDLYSLFMSVHADLIAEVIRQKAVYHSNIQILANELQFGEKV